MNNSRIIKFRAWDKTLKRFEYFDLPKLQIDSDLNYVDKLEVQQFTGLVDKKGNHIYEGDVLKVSGCGDKDWDTGVIWSEGGFVQDDGVPVAIVCDFDGKNCCEIIGNCFE